MSIELRKDKVQFCLDKKNMSGVKANVVFVLDISGSMHSLYTSGVVQDTVERLVAVASKLDTDGELGFWIFDHNSYQLNDINEANYHNVISDVMKRNNIFGGNDEPKVMRHVIDTYLNGVVRSSSSGVKVIPVHQKSWFENLVISIKKMLGMYKEPMQMKESIENVVEPTVEHNPEPTFVIFLSDGGCQDYSNGDSMESCIVDSSKHKLFWQFVGVGNANFGILEKLDNIKSGYVDNANFFKLNDLTKVTDEQIYDSLLNEFSVWLKDPKVQAMR